MRIIKNTFSIAILSAAIFLTSGIIFCQTEKVNSSSNFVIISPDDTPGEIIRKAANVKPSVRQYEWQKLELTGFIHFGINTFDEVEWGRSNTDITKFNPEDIDVTQWVKVFKDAGFKLIILTTKHHDGFCLWPSKYTDYDITGTPFMNGEGDIVRDLSQACKEAGMKFGVYLSPWDMHESSYGTPAYNEYFRNQLTELLTNYGEISEVWFDGANGEGSNGKRQEYDWNSYYKLIRKFQPNAVIAVMGPDVRWVGTESGYGRKTEWSVLPGTNMNTSTIAANSQQQSGDGAFIPYNLMADDLGSREKILNSSSLVWYPAEIDVSIRPGWFYSNGDDELVKSPSKLVDIYYNSVGLNGVLLLNIPPDKRGLIHKNDIKALQGMRYLLDNTFDRNFVENAKNQATSEQTGHEAKYILDDNPETFWTTNNNTTTATILLKLKRGYRFNCAMLQENILEGQRIEKFRLEYYDGQFWTKFAEGTTVGYKRLLKFPEVHADGVKIVIEQSRTNPTLSSFGLFKTPPEVTFEPNGGSFGDSIIVSLSSDSKFSKIYYTLDSSVPSKNSQLFSEKITISETTTITAIAIAKDGKEGLPVSASYNKAKYGIKLRNGYSEKYKASGAQTLVDGITGSNNFRDGKWQGYEGIDLDAVIDLGEVKKISEISAGFLSDVNSFIFLPETVEFSISEDSIAYASIRTLKYDTSVNQDMPFIKNFEIQPNDVSARYIRVQAKNIGTCPDWHKSAGSKTWLFCDEITIE